MRHAIASTFLLCTALAAQDRPPPPNFYLELGLAFGQVEYDTDGSDLDDDEGASTLRLRFDAVTDGGFGGGIDLVGTAAEELFVDQGFEPTDFDLGRVFPHLTFRFGGDRFTGMLRGGVLIQESGIEGTVSGDELRWSSVGFALGFEADYVFARGDEIDWSVYGGILLGGGSTDIELDPEGGSTTEFSTDSGFADLELGVRMRINSFRAGLGFLAQGTVHDESDITAGSFVFGTEQGFAGILVSLGVLF